MDEKNRNTQTSQVVDQQLEKNKIAIEKLKFELEQLDKKIRDGEKRLEESKELMSEYDELSERIVKLNQKMKSSINVPQNIKQHFDELLKRAEFIENALLGKGIMSMEDYNKLLKATKDNRQMFSRYNEMVANIEKQNEYYVNIALRDIQKEASAPEKRDFKTLLVQLKKDFDTQISNFEQLNDEITNIERRMKNLLVKQSIANEIFDTLRVVEAHLYRYENAREKLRNLNDDMLDKNGNLRDISERENYSKTKMTLDKQMKLDYEIMYTNNIYSMNDFDEKDTYNKKEKKEVEESIDFLNRKLRLLKEIEIESRKSFGIK